VPHATTAIKPSEMWRVERINRVNNFACAALPNEEGRCRLPGEKCINKKTTNRITPQQIELLGRRPRTYKGSMTHSQADVDADLCQGLVESYAVNERMNQIVLEHLDPAAWRANLPMRKGRTIAAIVAHVHNIRRKWLRLSAPQITLPAPLDRATCTQKQARSALGESAARCSEMLVDALARPQGDVTLFRRDGWARPWPAGAAMVAYMISHEAHHRGQVCMLAHQFGFPLPIQAASGIWAWETLWRQCGFTHPR